MLGGHVCAMHGGKIPAVKAASARRLLEQLVGPAIARLGELVAEDADVPPAVMYAAIKDILDRMGHKAPTQIEVITRESLEAEYERLIAENAQS